MRSQQAKSSPRVIVGVRSPRVPSVLLTLPNTTCLLSSHSALAVVMKNWHPLVFGPLFAIDSSPGPEADRGRSGADGASEA